MCGLNAYPSSFPRQFGSSLSPRSIFVNVRDYNREPSPEKIDHVQRCVKIVSSWFVYRKTDCSIDQKNDTL